MGWRAVLFVRRVSQRFARFSTSRNATTPASSQLSIEDPLFRCLESDNWTICCLQKSNFSAYVHSASLCGLGCLCFPWEGWTGLDRIGHCPWTLDELTVDRRPDPKKKEAKAASKKKNGYADKGAAVRLSC